MKENHSAFPVLSQSLKLKLKTKFLSNILRMDDYVLMWMRNEEIISLGNQILNNVGLRIVLSGS
jgi:hypothetical protein